MMNQPSRRLAYNTIMLDVTLYLVAMVISLMSIVLNVVSLPGNWVILVAALALTIGHHGHHPHWAFLIVIFMVLFVAEGIEFLSGLAGTKIFGGSKPAAWAAIGGAMMGGIIGFPPLTAAMFGIDHIVMAIFGAFVCAWVVELIRERPMKEALMAALGAALGRGAGLVTKIVAGVIAWVILGIAYWLPW